MKKKLSTFLVIIGILLISVPFTSELYIKYKQEKLYREMLDKIEKSANNGQNNKDTSNNNTNTDDTTSVGESSVDIMDVNFSEAIIQVEDNESKKEEK